MSFFINIILFEPEFYLIRYLNLDPEFIYTSIQTLNFALNPNQEDIIQLTKIEQKTYKQ
jgi:hypothetical protein